MRADAKRNRDAIVEAARVVFREKGYDAPLDDIAKRAGVGPGTLYRHFTDREQLMNAVMQAWVDQVEMATEKTLAFEGSSRDLLLEWFRTYVALISLHKGGPAKLTSAMGDETSPIVTKCRVLCGASERVLQRLEEEQALRGGVDALHVARLVGGVATIADNAGLPEAQVQPLLEVVADGMLRRTERAQVEPGDTVTLA